MPTSGLASVYTSWILPKQYEGDMLWSVHKWHGIYKGLGLSDAKFRLRVDQQVNDRSIRMAGLQIDRFASKKLPCPMGLLRLHHHVFVRFNLSSTNSLLLLVWKFVSRIVLSS